MKIQIIGTGIVGEATACLSKSLGYDVYGYDVKPRISPYYSNIDKPINSCDVTFICVNETLVLDIVEQLINKDVYNIVIRSTVLPNTAKELTKKYHRLFYHYPEFLREKTYLEDALNPSFALIGTTGLMSHEVYSYFNILKNKCKVIFTDSTTSEMVKLTLNNYLAIQIAFWCAINNISKTVGVNTKIITDIIKNDKRVSEYGYNPIGKGFNGKCLPKDLDQMINLCNINKVDETLFKAIRLYRQDNIK